MEEGGPKNPDLNPFNGCALRPSTAEDETNPHADTEDANSGSRRDLGP